MAIEWDRIGQQAFDRHAEALLHRIFDGPGQVIAVNGRGGDDGIDVKVTTEAGLRIFQLKYYPDGFPGSLKGRRTAIKKSFTRALKHGPVEWTLVVPCTLSPSERAFVDKLAGDRSVTVSVMDRPALDNGFADCNDLLDSFTRDQLREAARDFNVEKALLLRGDDLVERVRALGARSDGIDPHWTLDFQREGDTVAVALRGKHPRAHEASPIAVNLVRRADSMNADLSATVKRSLGFGIAEEVVLPAEAVERLTVDGPAWLSKSVSDVEVVWKPMPNTALAGAKVEVAFLSAAGAVAARYGGRLHTVGSGQLGASVDADLGGARLQMMLPFNTSAPAGLRYTFDLDGLSPAEAITVLRLHQRLRRGGHFRLSVEGVSAGSGTLPASGSQEDLEGVERLLLYLSDLEAVQRHCEAYFPAPLAYTGAERIELRIARLLIEGHCVAHPFARTLTFTLNGSDDPVLRTVLNGDPQCLRVSPPSYEITLGGHTLDIGPVHLFHTRVLAENASRVLKALDAGRAAGIKVAMHPADGEHFRFYLETAPDDGLPLIPVPLGLPGYASPL